ncbi:MAG: hypothetical protein QME79_00025 [Bacillota bacterium]|nr:hypothetical protein [Bacillota bacterium]
MIPWRSNQVVAAFLLGLGGITAATEACRCAQVPLEVAVPILGLAGVLAFAGSLLAMLAASLWRNRVRRAVRGGRRDVRDLCVAFLKSCQGTPGSRRRPGEAPLLLDDPVPGGVARLRRALAEVGVQASAAEVWEYVLLCRWAQRRLQGKTAPRKAGWLPAGQPGRPAELKCAG